MRSRRWFLGAAAGLAAGAFTRPRRRHRRTVHPAAAEGEGYVPVAVVNTGVFNNPFILGTTQPDATNTGYGQLGYTAGSLTVPAAPSSGTGWSVDSLGNLTITGNGTTIQGWYIKGMVQINANNCILQGCHVVSYPDHGYPGATHYGLVSSGGTGNIVQYCDIGLWDDVALTDNSGYDVVGSVTPYWPVGVLLTGGSMTVYRCNIHDVNDTLYVTGGTYTAQGNFIHDFMFRNDDADQSGNAALPYWSHNDGVQIMGGSNHVVDGNNFVLKFSGNTGMNSSGNANTSPTGSGNPNPDTTTAEQQWPNCHGLLLQNKNNSLAGLQITRNWFKYGTNAIVFVTTGGGFDPGGQITITGNQFTPDQGKQFNLYRQVSLTTTTAWPSVTFDGTNVYSFDTDTPVAVQGLPLNGNPPGNPGTAGGVEAWAYSQSAHTGNIPFSLTSP